MQGHLGQISLERHCGVFLELCVTAESDVESLEIECNSMMRLGI